VGIRATQFLKHLRQFMGRILSLPIRKDWLPNNELHFFLAKSPRRNPIAPFDRQSALSFSWAIARASSISSLSAFAWGNGRNRYRILSSASERAWSTTSFGWSDVEEAGSGSAAGGRFKSMSHRGQGFYELDSPEVPDTPTIRKGKTRSPKRMNTQAIK